MKVFLSWSGDRSKSVAMALRTWLPLVLHYVDPWLSEKDIAAGDRWTLEVGKGLDQSQFGIICLTRENLNAPWILFEAGALSKFLATSTVCPYLLDLEFSDIAGPLSQFQAKKADKAPTLELLQAINSKSNEPLDGVRLVELFDALWSKLEQKLANIEVSPQSNRQIRTGSEILEELVAVVRGMDQRLRKLESNFELQLSAVRRGDTMSKPLLLDGLYVKIFVESDMGKLKGGNRYLFPVRGPNFIELFATFAGLEPTEFEKGWWLSDNKGHLLTREESRDLNVFFEDSEPALTLTDIPW